MSTDLADWFAEHQERRIRNYRYHCTRCGRFVPMASVRTSYPGPDYERQDHGTCATHGLVEITWGES